MLRAEAIELLREISNRCGDSIAIDAITLLPHKKAHHPFSESPEQRYKLYLQTSTDLLSDHKMWNILKERDLR